MVHTGGAGGTTRAEDRLRRPTLKAGLRRLRRDGGALQLGIDPERALVVTGLDEAGRRWVEHIDGLRERPRLLRTASQAGLSLDDAAALLDLLAAADLLDDAAADCPRFSALPDLEQLRLRPDLSSLALVHRRPDGGRSALADRLSARVEVHGGGRVGAAVAGLLSAAGVGTVRVIDHEPTRPADLAPGGLGVGDLGVARGRAATCAALRARTVEPAPVRPADPRPPDLVVLAVEGPVPPALRDALIAAEVPHLVAYVRETTGVVGPLVLPRRSSCLLCHDLTRADRDPAWPRLAAQLATEPPPEAGPECVAPCDTVLAAAVASHAALQALTFLGGGHPSAVDGTLEIALPEGTVRRRSWRRHPACGCGWADAS